MIPGSRLPLLDYSSRLDEIEEGFCFAGEAGKAGKEGKEKKGREGRKEGKGRGDGMIE